MPQKAVKWRFVPLGDSYTKGEGTTSENSWPSLLIKHLQQDGIDITLVTNAAQSGWTTQEALELELAEFKMGKPNIATLMIGANDLVQGVSLEEFRRRFAVLLDEMLAILPQKDKLVVITLPDFSSTPVGKAYNGAITLKQGIRQYNAVIVNEAKKRRLTVVDLYGVSKAIEKHPEMVSEDGLHPSALGYAEWEKHIYPVMKKKIR
jgi:lysophospholipase L1-like esterase